ncbi:MAG: BamA/TamA family outer membrane protein [Candidatus Krumholzibacteriia bacterium]
MLGALLLLESLVAAGRATVAARPLVHEDFYPHRRGQRVVFSIQAPANARVHLIGDFNDWDRHATPLEYVGDDVWEVALRLSESVYEYKFVVDGRHLLDPSNPDEVTARDGSVRSRIKVLSGGRVSQYGRRHHRRDRVPTRVTFSHRGHSRFTVGGDYSFTRVDGSMLWLNLKYRSTYDYTPELRVGFGYGWESERTTYEADLAQPLLRSRALNVGVYLVDGTGYENQSGIGWRENTLAALFFKHDFNDYYHIQGVEPYVSLRLPGYSTLRVSWAVEDYDSLTSKTDWSFFKAGRDRFRPNPPLFLLEDPDGLGGAGRLKATRVELVHDSRRARHVGTVGTYVRGFLEVGDGDFSYARWISDGRAYMRLGPPVHVALRFTAGGRFGNPTIPSQKLFYVGGLGTVRGHEFRLLTGDHQIVGNLEYTLLFGDLDYGLLFFYDAGTAWNSTVERLDDATILQAVGFGLKSADNDFQIHVAKPVGEIEGDIETTVRLQRTF